MYAKIKNHPPVAQLYGEQARPRTASITREDARRALGREEGRDAAARASAGPSRRRSPGAPAERRPRWSTRPPCGGGSRPSSRPWARAPEGFEIHPKLAATSRSARELLEGKGEVGLGHGGVPGLRHAAPRGHPGAALRPGLRPRHLQPAPRRSSTTSARGKEYVALNALAPERRALRGPRQPPVRGRGDGLRVRLLRGRAPAPS